MFSFLCTLICYELNYISRYICNKELDFILLLNLFVVYSLPTTMRSLTENHTMDLFYLLKKNFKILLFDLLIMGRSFENFTHHGWAAKEKN